MAVDTALRASSCGGSTPNGASSPSTTPQRGLLGGERASWLDRGIRVCRVSSPRLHGQAYYMRNAYGRRGCVWKPSRRGRAWTPSRRGRVWMEALKAKLYAKYGDLRIQPARPSECEHTSLHDAPSLLDLYVDLHGPLHCLPDDDVETGAAQESEEVCLRYLDTLPLPGRGARRSHRGCERLWHTIPAPRHRRQTGCSGPPAHTGDVASGGDGGAALPLARRRSGSGSGGAAPIYVVPCRPTGRARGAAAAGLFLYTPEG